MRFTSIVTGIVKDSSGSSVWQETSQLRLPKGGKKLTFKQNALILIGIGVCVFSYAQFQAEFNPDSWWGKQYRQVTTNPFGFLTETKRSE
ncbi:hypothetical protein QR680_001378 [Steinernema hermaphroditum]|uniref:Uncharacterized protein n=1 Tax=Steinernema hermaphroditum TaxID=289476 RepID=A0AA39LFB5_9BILA|nr:hypothetical protein QR680_001378 [Steinernema hermaphroditum]